MDTHVAEALRGQVMLQDIHPKGETLPQDLRVVIPHQSCSNFLASWHTPEQAPSVLKGA